MRQLPEAETLRDRQRGSNEVPATPMPGQLSDVWTEDCRWIYWILFRAVSGIFQVRAQEIFWWFMYCSAPSLRTPLQTTETRGITRLWWVWWFNMTWLSGVVPKTTNDKSKSTYPRQKHAMVPSRLPGIGESGAKRTIFLLPVSAKLLPRREWGFFSSIQPTYGLQTQNITATHYAVSRRS